MHHRSVLLEADVHVVAVMVDSLIAEHHLEAHAVVLVENRSLAALILDHSVAVTAAAVVALLTGADRTQLRKPAACGLGTAAKDLAADSAAADVVADVDLLVVSGTDRTDHSPLADELAGFWAVADVASRPQTQCE